MIAIIILARIKQKLKFLFYSSINLLESFPHVQILRYICNIFDMQIKEKIDKKIKKKDFHLRLVIPIIFYHGKNKWNKIPFMIISVKLMAIKKIFANI